ncbi:hypothetical protein F4778DRAFT_797341 [Xylariomycetidae sp. FL2044]|nr:hypothetical protein F4778DRAFT_797341 [Xylariomycetidae sp. FL2044]
MDNDPVLRARAAQEIKRRFPKWVDEQEAQLTDTALTMKDGMGVNGNSSEFILCPNWIFFPEGLEIFSEKLCQSDLAPEVMYDIDIPGFRVKCPFHEEEDVMILLQQVMDYTVRRGLENDELSKYFSLPQTKSILSIDEWDEPAQIKPEERSKYEKWSFPRAISEAPCRCSWSLPDKLVNAGSTTSVIFTDQTLSELCKVTGCIIQNSFDERTVYVGAPTQEQLAVATRKLDTLAKFHGRETDFQAAHSIVLYTEHPGITMCRMTYLSLKADGQFFKTCLLDPSQYRLKTAYGTLSKSGVVVEGMRFDRMRKSFVCLSRDTMRPTVQGKHVREPFRAFLPSTSFTYAAKHDDGIMDKKVSGPSPPTLFQASQDIAKPGTFAAHRQPNVERWLSKLPEIVPTTEETKPSSSKSDTSIVTPSNPTPTNVGVVLPSEGTVVSSSPPQQAKTPPTRTPTKHADQGSDTLKHQPIRYVPPHLRQTTPNRTLSSRNTSDNGLNVSKTGESSVVSLSMSLESFQARLQEGVRHVTQPAARQESVHDEKEEEHVDQEPGTSQTSPDLPGEVKRSNELEMEPIEEPKPAQKPRVLSFNFAKENQQTPKFKPGLGPNPFEDIWSHARTASGSKINQYGSSGILGKNLSGSPRDSQVETRKPQIVENEEAGSRVFHETMRQQAGSRSGTAKTAAVKADVVKTIATQTDEVDDETLHSLNKKLVRMLRPLGMSVGHISLKVEFGRFYLTSINKDYVQLPGEDSKVKNSELKSIAEQLNRVHTDPSRYVFSRIISTEGGDANYLAFLKDSKGKRMWHSLDRQTIYEIFFEAMTEEEERDRFVLEIDGTDFSYQLRQDELETTYVTMHCIRRTWDFRFMLSASKNLEKSYGEFAREFVRLMRVMPQKSGIPIVELKLRKVYMARIRRVRTRNVATYRQPAASPGLADSPELTVLHISEVHEMCHDANKAKDDAEALTVQYAQAEGNPKKGQAGTFYEASLQSKVVTEALEQNRVLEFGDEVSWSAEDFKKSGAFNGLIRTACNMVKRMDGVGYWCDNYQHGMIHGQPQAPEPSKEKPGVIYW